MTDRVNLLAGLVALGIVGFVVLASTGHASEGYGLLAAIPALGALVVGVQVKTASDSLTARLDGMQSQLDDTSTHLAGLRNGELVAKVTEGVKAGLADHLAAGIVEPDYRPPSVPFVAPPLPPGTAL